MDVRIIAAAHQDLSGMIKEGRFREDLYYRLNVSPIQIPPLGEHTQDIPALIHHFIANKVKQLRLPERPFLATDSIQDLMTYPWPGNVCEMKNLVERALIIDPKGPLDLHAHLPAGVVVPPVIPNDDSGTQTHFPSEKQGRYQLNRFISLLF